MAKHLLLVLTLLLCGPAWSADGDAVSGSAVSKGDFSYQEFYLCDSDTGDGACLNEAVDFKDIGWPSHYAVAVRTDCTTGTIVVTGSDFPGDSTGKTLATLTVGSTEDQALGAPDFRLLDAAISATSGPCTDIDVVVKVWWSRGP